MKNRILIALLSAVLGSPAFAQEACPCGSGTLVSDAAQLAALLGGKTVCATVGTEVWQEFHSGSTPAGGPLVDYKKGPNDPVDPSETVGSWSIPASTARARGVAGVLVAYNYGSGGTYSYAVCQSGAQVNFCGQRNVTGATLVAGQSACPGVSRRR